MIRPLALARLVRLPSVLTVPGDVLVGNAWGGEGEEPTTLARLALGSSLLYLAGMALNDWADRELDGRERPWRPIPAGDVPPSAAIGAALGLTGGAIVAHGRGGRLGRASALTTVVWVYDLRAKDTFAGPWTMALARAMDVLVGADRPVRRAGPPAAIVAAHTLLITLVSAREVDGADSALAKRVFAGIALTTAAAAKLILLGRRGSGTAALPLTFLVLYGCEMGRAGVRALRQLDAAHLQGFVGTGVLANMPLQAALLASRGRRGSAATLVVAWPLARWTARRMAVT
jgi:hypothetical protein